MAHITQPKFKWDIPTFKDISKGGCFLCKIGAVCKTNNPIGIDGPAWYESKCNNCGKFAFSPGGFYSFEEKERIESNKKYTQQKYLLSAYAKRLEIQGRNPPIFVVGEELEDKKELDFVSSVGFSPVLISDAIDSLSKMNMVERFDWGFTNLCELSKSFGERINPDEIRYPMFCVEDDDKKGWMLKHLKEREYWDGYLQDIGNGAGILKPSGYSRITIKGWERYEEILKGTPNKDSRQGFVAMKFKPEMDRIYTEGLHKAIEEAGYKPLRIDNLEHSNKICDEIIAQIRRSRFLVADMTGQNNGVYFEAGFATALGIPVILTCKKEEVDNLHFDTRQYNHILWESESDLYDKLKARIMAVIG